MIIATLYTQTCDAWVIITTLHNQTAMVGVLITTLYSKNSDDFSATT